MEKLSRRDFLRVSTLATAATVAAACVQPAAPAEPAGPATSVPEPTAVPTKLALPTQAPPAPTEPSAPVTRYREAPQLAELVAQGTLPPVDERLPENPSVYPVLEMIGNYGGTLRRGFSGVSDRWGPTKVRDCSLVHYNFDLTLRPDICEAWEQNEDASAFTIHLRKGMKWSDGEPFDSSAISWWYDNQVKNEELTKSPPRRYRTGDPGTLMELDILDDYNVIMTFADPYPMFMYFQNRSQPFVPGHHMRKYHIDLCDDKDALLKEVEEKGFNSWDEYYNDRNYWYANLERPDVTPWIAKTPLSGELFVMERNPYYCAVDAEGQQLPYVDRVNHRLFETGEVLNMWIVNGEIDWQSRHVDIGNYTLFKENEESGDFRLLLWKQDEGDVLSPNHNCKDPRIAEFFQNRDVRIGLNLSVDRDTVNELARDGLGMGRQCSPPRMSPQYSEEAEKAYAWYSPDEANEYLDKAGYAERDADGFRLWNDGSGDRIFFVIEGTAPTGDASSDAVQLVVKYFGDVGVNCTWRSEERSLYEEHWGANETEAAWWSGGQEHLAFLSHSQYYLGEMVDRPWAGGWGLWYRDHGDPNGEPPPDGHFLWDMWAIWEEAKVEPDADRRNELYGDIVKIWSREVPAVGVVGELPAAMIAKNGLRNFAEGYLSGNQTANESLLGSCTLFWDEPDKHM